MTDVIQDLRYAMGMLAKRPGLSTITILILTLGIGGSVSSFSVVDAALLRPLPFDRPDGLFSVWERPPQGAPWTRQTVPFSLACSSWPVSMSQGFCSDGATSVSVRWRCGPLSVQVDGD
jgi:hypothetical protein